MPTKKSTTEKKVSKKPAKKAAKKAAPKTSKAKTLKEVKTEKVQPVKSSSPSEIVPKAISQGKAGISQSEIVSQGKKQKKIEAIESLVGQKDAQVAEDQKKEKDIALAENLGKYFYAVGRRKTSVAQVRLYENEKATDADLIINGKKMKEYFPIISMQNNLIAPFKAVGAIGKFKMTAIVRGGGFNGQVEAIRLGIARALVLYNETFKKTLKDLGLMTRDAREVERKKPGLKKARRAPQWAKR